MSKHMVKVLTELGVPPSLARRASGTITSNKEHISNLYDLTRSLQRRIIYLFAVCVTLAIAVGAMIYFQSKFW